MFKSYFSVALRHLLAQKLYSAINVAGLAVGLACFILIGLFVSYELSYDGQWAAADRIHRVSRDFFESAETREARLAGMAAPAAPLLKQDFPQIEQAARIFCCGAVVKRSDGEAFLERGYAEADNELFGIFDFEWLRGDPATALTDPYDIVLTRSAAQRHFGDDDPIGQTLLTGGGNGAWEALDVAGVIEDLPENTHLRFDMLRSLLGWTNCGCEDAAALERYFNDWSNNVFYTYVLLRQGASIAEIQSGSAEFLERHLGQGASDNTGFTAAPITDIHLRSDREAELWSREGAEPAGSMTTVYTFTAVATFILLLACINFMNLATAGAAQRAKEIGVRKVVGAERWHVSMQFFGESVLLALIAVLVAVTLVELALPAFNAFLGQDLTFEYLSDPGVLLALALLALATGLVAGSYPAFYLATFRPAPVLKGDMTRGSGAAGLRKGLVVLQFSISIALLIATAAVYGQMRFINSLELGYDKDQIVVLSPNNVEGEQWETLKREWLAHPGITHVTGSDRVPSETNARTAEIRGEGPDRRARRMQFVVVDHGFFETYDIEVVAGRAFSPAFGTDRPTARREETDLREGAFVISELAARQLGWVPEAAVGEWLELGSPQGSRFRVDELAGPVIGVVKDVYFESLHSAIEPTVYMMSDEAGGTASLRITGRDLEGTLAFIDEKWKEVRPDLPASLRFLDQEFEALYQAETRQARMFTIFSALAIFIACLGLFGLAAFATERRTKEIGIRKALGGSVLDIVRLLTADFSRPVLLANVAAWPVAYFVMQSWLARFAYRIDMSVWIFAGSALLALVVAWLAVGVVATRAARAKPINALRYE